MHSSHPLNPACSDMASSIARVPPAAALIFGGAPVAVVVVAVVMAIVITFHDMAPSKALNCLACC